MSSENESELQLLMKDIKNYKNALHSRINSVESLLQSELDDLQSIDTETTTKTSTDISQSNYKIFTFKLPESLFEIVVLDFVIDNQRLTIDTVLNFDGWRFDIFTRYAKSRRSMNEMIKQLFEKKGINGTFGSDDATECKFRLEDDLDYDTDDEVVVQKIISVLNIFYDS